MKVSGSTCKSLPAAGRGRWWVFCRWVRSDPGFALFTGATFFTPFSFPLGRLFLALALLSLVLRYLRLRRFPPIPAVAGFGLAFILLTCIVTIHGVNPEIGCGKLRKLFWFVGLPVAAIVVTDVDRLRKIFVAMAAGTTILAIQILVENPLHAMQAVQAGTFSEFGAALIGQGSMTDGQRLVVGLVASLACLFSRCGRRFPESSQPGGRFLESRSAWLYLLAGIGLQSVAFLINFKRGSWLVALVVVGIFVVTRIHWKWSMVLAAVVLLSLFLPPVKQRINALGSEFEPYHGGRITMWRKIAPELIRRHPWGLGYRSLTNDMMREIAWEVESDRDHLHSNIVQLLVATGWAGLILYMAWMVRALWDSWRFFRSAHDENGAERTLAMALLLILLALLLNGLVEYNFGDAELVLIYGYVMGCCAAGAKRSISS